ncbi:MAG: hypothetical protein ACXW09_14900 [Methylococcaceae bacterium]
MKNRLIIVTACLLFSGCASWKYPGWEQVSLEQSVFKKPCLFRKEELCRDEDDCISWYKKRAVAYKANTIVIDRNLNGAYFYCASGIPPFIAKPDSIWFISNKFNPEATQLDLDKAVAECTYESHKATIDTSKPLQERISFPLDPIYSIVKHSADEKDRLNQEKHRHDLEKSESMLYEQCLGAKGFVYTRASDEASLDKLNKHCPGIDNLAAPCFITGIQK